MIKKETTNIVTLSETNTHGIPTTFLSQGICQEKELELIMKEISSRLDFRNMSWELCRNAFESNKTANDDNTIELLALHLTAYLASFGMYRGSTMLLKYCDYKVHIGAVKILLNKTYLPLYGFDPLSANENDLSNFYKLFYKVYDELYDYYKKQADFAIKQIKQWYKAINYTPDTKFPNVTVTLITKIILGVYGCCPAYDKLGVDGIKSLDIPVYERKNSRIYPRIKDLINGVKKNKTVFANVQKIYKQLKSINPLYTSMRALDLILWSIGKGIESYKKLQPNAPHLNRP